MLPGILTQLGQEGLNHLKRLANNVVVGNKLLGSVNEEEDDVPNLVENFEDASKQEVVAGDAQKSPVAETEGEKSEPAVASPEKSATEAKIEQVAAEVAATSLEDTKKQEEETTPKKSDDKSKKNEKGSGSSGKKDKQQNKDKKA